MLEQKAKNVIHLGLLFKQLKNEETEECDKLIRRFLPDINQSYKGQESFDITENVKKYLNWHIYILVLIAKKVLEYY